MAVRYGHRATLVVPLRREGKATGAILVRRREPRPFTDGQIRLLETFADQAVTIENARLLNELRESLQQQTATADVLKVISSSPGELGTVFKAMLENATRVCGAKFGVMFYYQDGTLRPAAELNVPKAFSEFIRQRGPFQPGPGSVFKHLILTKQPINVADGAAEGQFFVEQCGQVRRGAQLHGRADAQGGRADWRNSYLPPGGAAVHRQADRAFAKFCCPSRYRH